MKYVQMDLSSNFNVTFMGQCKFNEPWIQFARTCDEYILYVVKEGVLYIEEEHVRYTVRQGEYLILEPKKFHIGYKKATVHYYFIHLTNTQFNVMTQLSKEQLIKDINMRRRRSLASDITTSSYKNDAICVVPKFYKFNQQFDLYQLLDTACYELNHKEENFKLLSVLLATQILIKMNRQFNSETVAILSQKSYSTVKKLMTYLEGQIENKITISDVEAFIGLNYNYVNSIFKKTTGYTIKNYLNLLKIQYAQKQMRETALTFNEISEMIGIDDPFYFSKLFKSKTGLTPTQYKKEIYFS